MRDLSATAATVLLGSPRSLLSRYRHTWDAKDSKLGGDVNGPGQTNAGIRSRVQSRGAGAGLERQKGWDRDKKKKKGDEAPPNTLERARTTEETPLPRTPSLLSSFLLLHP